MFSAFKTVFKRELSAMLRRPIYLFSTIFVIAFCHLFFLTLMHEGLPEKLPVAVVDMDQSVISRRLCKEINTTALSDIVLRTGSYQEAHDAMMRGEVYGFIIIPKDFYKKILRQEKPEIQFYINSAYLVAGNFSYKNFLTMSIFGNGAFQREVLRKKGLSEDAIMAMIRPIVIDTHQIGNAEANYGVYLINVLIPGILQLMVLLMTIFPIGIELKRKTSVEWLEAGNGSLAISLAGKLLPYTIIFTILGIAGNVILFKFMKFPFSGSFIWYNFGMIFYVLASQAIGTFMIGLFPVLRDGISFAALYGIISFTFSGFTFPVEAMPNLVQGLSYLFPLRYYFKFYVSQAIMGNPFVESLPYYAAFMIFLTLPFLIYYRLKNALIYQNYPLK